MEKIPTSQQNIEQSQKIEHSISDVLYKIKNKEISIHSKTFFRLKWIAFMAIVLAICFVSVLLCSFILFNIKVTGQSYLINFGSQGVKVLFLVFPWILFVIDVLLIMLLGMLTRHVSFGYKIPGVYVLLGVIGIIIISGYVVESKTNFHTDMLFRADKKDLPLFAPMYKNVRRAPPIGFEIYRGTVIDKGEGFIRVDIHAEDGVGTTSRVSVVFATSSSHASGIRVGQTVFLSGKIIDGQVIEARLKPIPQLPIMQ